MTKIGKKIGHVALGKLGLPVAVCMANAGHDVMGYDLDSSRMSLEPQPYRETGPDGYSDFNDHLARCENLRFGSMEKVVAHSDIIFVSVQTPHKEEYEGITRIPDTRVDFDYSFLIEAQEQLNSLIADQDRKIVVCIISTVLPGTMRRCLLPNLPKNAALVYNPSFIAMGTTMRDFYHPEFVLAGSDHEWALDRVEEFYKTIISDPYGGPQPPVIRMSIPSAELTKVSYNTYIGQKISFVNTLMEICHKIPEADVDEVTGALKKATRRLISPAYMSGGMGDGGGCHPRDNIAMSWLAGELGLSHDLFDDLMQCREDQAEWLANLMISYCGHYGHPLQILGYAFKPETDLTVGSPALLVQSILEERGYPVSLHDPRVEGKQITGNVPYVYLIGCRHPEFVDWPFARGSVVIDPWRYIPDQEGLEVIRLGEKSG